MFVTATDQRSFSPTNSRSSLRSTPTPAETPTITPDQSFTDTSTASGPAPVKRKMGVAPAGSAASKRRSLRSSNKLNTDEVCSISVPSSLL